MKQCIKCKEIKELSSFHKHKQMKDGHLNKCSICVYECVAEWRIKNPNYRKEEHRRNALKNGIVEREEYLRNRKENAVGKKITSNKYAAKRRVQTTREMTELDDFIITEAFVLAAEREKETGIKWHVDHIIPLNHKNICGLHVGNNVQVVPAVWNLRKSNTNTEVYI